MRKFNHAFNLMYEQIKQNFGNISVEFDLFLSKSKNYTQEIKELHANMNNLNSLVDQLRLNYTNFARDPTPPKLHTNMNNLTTLVDQLRLNYTNLAKEIKSKFEINKQIQLNNTNLTSLVDQLRLNYINLAKDLQSKFEINKQIQLNNKNLTEEIQLISNTSKLHSKFQFNYGKKQNKFSKFR